jgi:hypothetical protein
VVVIDSKRQYFTEITVMAGTKYIINFLNSVTLVFLWLKLIGLSFHKMLSLITSEKAVKLPLVLIWQRFLCHVMSIIEIFGAFDNTI